MYSFITETEKEQNMFIKLKKLKLKKKKYRRVKNGKLFSFSSVWRKVQAGANSRTQQEAEEMTPSLHEDCSTDQKLKIPLLSIIIADSFQNHKNFI